ncbi:MAG: toxin-antitoxin system YwqK family antitoxin [Bacteroidales bacterium]|jgi:antitoxin component YwqK of YwqJK toxin-antitoxin module
MKKLIIYFITALLSFSVYGQTVTKDTTNKIDAKGNKQGYWKKYVHDTLKYVGTFKDNIPVGQFKYYYGDGKLKTTMIYSNNGKFCTVTMFYPSGKKEADGFYTDMKKDSVWKYYSENDTIISEEHYKATKKNGVWKFFYSNGVINEEVTWVNDIRNGPWKMYFSDGKLKLDGKIINGLWQGLFKYYFLNGTVYYTGFYKDNEKDGIWIEYSEDSHVVKKETYKNGALLKTEDLQPKKDNTQPQK